MIKIEKDMVVTLHYTLRGETAEGDIIEETYGKNPMTFIYGIGQMIPGFEANLIDKIEGDKYAFLLGPGEAYGAMNAEAIVEVPMANFAGENGKVHEDDIAIGHPVRMKNQNGQSFQGMIKSTTKDTVTVDFNHPMAGRSLHFSGEIIEVRTAREDELTKGFAGDAMG